MLRMRPPRSRPSSLSQPLLLSALLFAAGPASALYKVVGPDGSITYTDRPPADARARISQFGRDGSAAPAAEAPLPLDLRLAVNRYPVVLYTAADCPPCDAGRQLLQRRGVPYTERSVSSDEDTAALERLAGGRMVPALTIGAQALRGLSQSEWSSYLDAAGYPRDSRLPRGWTPPPVTPLVARTPPQRTARSDEPPAQPPAPPPALLPVDPAPNALRF